MRRIFYSPNYAGSGFAFDTTRKAKWVADSFATSPIHGIELIEPDALTEDQVVAVHDPAYVRAVRTGTPHGLAQSQGFSWDAGLWPMVLASNGGAAAAALAALEDGVAGSLSSGLHHARHGNGAGFCTFNGLAIAAREALAAGVKSVLILDLDAHCGGGTASLIAGEPRIWQVDVSVDNYDWYCSTDRIQLDVIEESAKYLTTVHRSLGDLDRQGVDFDLCLYNAGMDPFEDCSTGGLRGITRDLLSNREQAVFEWCRRRKLPVAFVLAGGHVGPGLDQQGLVELHRLTLSWAARI